MATFVKFYQFSEDLAKGVHNLSTGALTLALCNAANAPSVSADAVLADITPIAYTNLSTLVLSVTSCEHTSGVTKLIIADHVLTASGGSVAGFRYVIVYNDTPTSPANPLIGYYDYGSDLVLASGESLTVNFDGTNGVLQIT